MRICVFCGSATGFDPVFAEAARELGSLMAARNITLIYGGGNVGLMGILADSVLASNGKVIGVIPGFLAAREVAHTRLTELILTDSMHERKRKMADLSDAFIALPGGWGTLDELAEILTWKQLGLLKAPVGLLNTDQFFDPLLLQMEKMVSNGFLGATQFQYLQIASQPGQLLARLA